MAQEATPASETAEREKRFGWEPESDNEHQPEPDQVVPWRRIFFWMAVVVAGMFVLLVLLDKVVMPWYVKHGSEAKVPDVVGMPYPEAEKLLKKEGFQAKRAEPHYSDKFPAGTVMMQLPYGGAITKEGRHIYLTESRGVEMIPVPDVTGRPLREARITLMRQGFDVGDVTYEENDSVMRDLVFAQSVPSKVGARPGTSISLSISKGPAVRYTMMPELVGLGLDDARARLESAGLTLGVVRKKRSDRERNAVIEQSSPAYSQVAERSAINITISDPDAPEADESAIPQEEAPPAEEPAVHNVN